ncbi:hypothetical protein ANN_27311 [Periplaneta americana]|uniref:Uncharacterized protein n=1 Tax=Periplaneta americana TaxID=6978 RepID=A0ABQ8RXZ3_PERAM|nr:hypothetical protein ANN_27311 [Periplaneta americana]
MYGCETWTLTLREEHRLRVFENKVLRKIFGTNKDEVTGEWRKLHNAELHALYSSPDIIRNIKSRRLRWAEHVAHMGESINAYRVLVGRLEGKRPLERPRLRWEDNIKMDLRRQKRGGGGGGSTERRANGPKAMQQAANRLPHVHFSVESGCVDVKFASLQHRTISSQFAARLSWLVLLAESLAFTESRTPDLQRRSAELRTQVPQLRSTALELLASGSTVTDTTQDDDDDDEDDDEILAEETGDSLEHQPQISCLSTTGSIYTDRNVNFVSPA